MTRDSATDQMRAMRHHSLVIGEIPQYGGSPATAGVAVAVAAAAAAAASRHRTL